MTEERLQKKLQQWEKKRKYIVAKEKIKSEKKDIKSKHKPSTSKFLMAFLFINCSIIELYTMFVIILSMKMGFEADFGPLQMLITAVVAQVIGYAIYSLKASKENSSGGIVYETAIMKLKSEDSAEEEQEEIVG